MDWFSNLMKEIGTFLGLCGAPAVKVSLDIFAQVAQGGTTPQQVAATIADLKSLNDAASAAADACAKMDGTETHSVLSSAVDLVNAVAPIATAVADSGMINESAAAEVKQVVAETQAITASPEILQAITEGP
jgi:hypothetical protein